MLSFTSKNIKSVMTSTTNRLSMLNNHISIRSNSTNSSLTNEITCNVSNTARIITLNRPSKLNALNTSMVNELTSRLIEFSKSNSNNLIILNSSSDKAYCSGGDVIQCAKNNLNNESSKSIEFFQKEYSLNYLLSIYNKPIVVIDHGIVMGGGVGLSIHSPFRIITDSTEFAMPETNIGFFSDVGTSFWLPKLDGNLGYYLSLTGDTISGIDNLITGFGTHYVPKQYIDQLIERLSNLEIKYEITEENEDPEFVTSSMDLNAIINETIEEFSHQIPSNHKFKFNNDELNIIEKCFNPDEHKTVSSIIESLEKNGSDFAINIISKLKTKSPISLELCYQLLKKNAFQTNFDSISNELILASKMMINYEKNDFNEFITKNLINKKSTNPNDKILKPVFKDLNSIPKNYIDKLINKDISKPNLDLIKIDESLSQEEKDNLKLIKMEEIHNQLSNAKIQFNSKINSGFSDYFDYPFNNGLPTQYEIEDYIKGEDDSNRKYSVTFKEAIKYFDIKYHNRHGLHYKVKHVLNRKTKSSEYGDEYLEWVD